MSIEDSASRSTETTRPADGSAHPAHQAPPLSPPRPLAPTAEAAEGSDDIIPIVVVPPQSDDGTNPAVVVPGEGTDSNIHAERSVPAWHASYTAVEEAPG